MTAEKCWIGRARKTNLSSCASQIHEFCTQALILWVPDPRIRPASDFGSNRRFDNAQTQKRKNRFQAPGPHLLSRRWGPRLSTITGFGGGWNTPGSEGPVICRRPGPARTPTGAHHRGQDCFSQPRAPETSHSPPAPGPKRGSSQVARDFQTRLSPSLTRSSFCPRLASSAALTAGDRGWHRE